MSVAIATLEGITCAECGCIFGLTPHFIKQRREDHQYFYCPKQHVNHYPAETEADRLRKDLAREISMWSALEAQINSGKSKCPKCRRVFTHVNFLRHLKKHEAKKT